MDELDKSILQVLQKNARTSLKTVGSQINLSVPATSERLRKLERSGYIKGYTALLNHGKFNKSLICFCLVILKGQNFSNDKQFRSFVIDCPDILECHCIAGEYEYLLKIVTESTQTLETLLYLLRSDWGVVKSKTYAVLSLIKENPSITL